MSQLKVVASRKHCRMFLSILSLAGRCAVYFAGLREVYFDTDVERNALECFTAIVGTLAFPLFVYFCLFTFIVAALVSVFRIEKLRIVPAIQLEREVISSIHVRFLFASMLTQCACLQMRHHEVPLVFGEMAGDQTCFY
jgi:glucan phosphoethanolaminetransferase (alkaline phosphatase superfamily)